MNSIILKTKLQRPIPGRDTIARPRLLQQLDQCLYCRLTLLTAPAGYGKSTLASQWLSGLIGKTGWLSCDAEDDDLVRFFLHLATVFDRAMPGLCNDTRDLLAAIPTPSSEIIVDTLINDVADLSETFVLVVDDYHLISNSKVHAAMRRLLGGFPQTVHVVLCSRRNPPWDLVEWRTRNQLVEIRLKDLAFSETEAQTFFNTALDVELAAGVAGTLAQRMDGWPAGLRLVQLALNQRPDLLEQTGEIDTAFAVPRDVTSLLEMVLGAYTWEQQELLVRLSIVDQFCAPLITVLLGAQDNPEADPSESLMDWLRGSDLFLIALDQAGKWYRFHHLLRDHLQQQLVRRFQPDEIRALHCRVSAWFAAQGNLDAAINHALLGGNHEQAIRLLAENRRQLINEEQWHQLRKWLDRFSAEMVRSSPHLLLIHALLEDNLFLVTQVDTDQLATLIAERVSDEAEAAIMQAEVDVLRAAILNSTHRDHAQAAALAQRALEVLPEDWTFFRLMAATRMGAAKFGLGDIAGAYALLHRWDLTIDSSNIAHRSRLALHAIWVYTIASDIEMLRSRAKDIIGWTEPRILPGTVESWASAHNALAYDAYLQNRLDIAEQHFSTVWSQCNRISHFEAGIAIRGIALIYQLRGANDQVWEMVRELTKIYQKMAGGGAHDQLVMFTVELMLRSNRVAAAAAAGQSVALQEPFPRAILHWYSEHITVIKLLLRQGGLQNHRRAATILKSYQEFLQRVNCWHVLSETLTLQAILQDLQGDERAAFETLQQAIQLAQPRNYIRCLADAGPQLIPLLQRFRPLPDDKVFVQRVLEALLTSPTALATAGHRADQVLLTQHELEILRLLGYRWTNQEISEQLFISVATVKRHTYNIFQKLDVTSRREAVKAATELGLLE